MLQVHLGQHVCRRSPLYNIPMYSGTQRLFWLSRLRFVRFAFISVRGASLRHHPLLFASSVQLSETLSLMCCGAWQRAWPERPGIATGPGFRPARPPREVATQATPLSCLEPSEPQAEGCTVRAWVRSSSASDSGDVGCARRLEIAFWWAMFLRIEIILYRDLDNLVHGGCGELLSSDSFWGYCDSADDVEA